MYAQIGQFNQISHDLPSALWNLPKTLDITHIFCDQTQAKKTHWLTA